jgi:hypothetical protein
MASENPMFWFTVAWASVIALVSLYYVVHLTRKVKEVHFRE